MAETPDLDRLFEHLMLETWQLLAWLPLLFIALLVVWLAWLVGGWLSRRAWLGRFSRRNPFLDELIRTTTRWLLTLLGMLVALEILGATALLGALLGTAGVLGIALGFAFKDTLENYLAGILMSLRQPFAPNDHVVIDGNEGVVIGMTSRATILMTLDGNHLRLPNALVFRSVTLNYSRNPQRRFEFDVGIGVGDSIAEAQRVVVERLGQVDGVLADPPPRPQVVALGDWSVQLRFFGWIDQRTHDFLLVRSEAIRQAKRALDAAGIDMPEPTYRLARVGGAAAKEVVGERRAAAIEPAVATLRGEVLDTRVQGDLDPSVAADRGALAGNLLDPAAPRE